MLLPGRLRGTTLGDLLGVLYRAGATGTLELVEDRGRTHRVHLSAGRVVAVELDGTTTPLADILRRERVVDDDVLKRSLLRAMAAGRLHGEVLVSEFHLAPEVVGRAVRRQLLSRLSALEALADARVAFRVTVRPPREAVSDAPLEPLEFLRGRKRARDRESSSTPFPPPPSPPPVPAPVTRAWSILGLPPGTSPDEIKRTYRRLARSFHPDLHPHASDRERRALELRFAEITDAFRELVA
jgi:hypothetical protein